MTNMTESLPKLLLTSHSHPASSRMNAQEQFNKTHLELVDANLPQTEAPSIVSKLKAMAACYAN